MTCQGCNALEEQETLVTLRNGRVVCNTCPDWMHECEARHLLVMDNASRIEQLEVIAKKRGKPAMESLRATMAEIYRGQSK